MASDSLDLCSLHSGGFFCESIVRHISLRTSSRIRCAFGEDSRFVLNIAVRSDFYRSCCGMDCYINNVCRVYFCRSGCPSGLSCGGLRFSCGCCGRCVASVGSGRSCFLYLCILYRIRKIRCGLSDRTPYAESFPSSPMPWPDVVCGDALYMISPALGLTHYVTVVI